jgi:hypothetical protein
MLSFIFIVVLFTRDVKKENDSFVTSDLANVVKF